MTPHHAIFYLWALPTTAVGLTAFVVAATLGPILGVGRVRADVVDGVLELQGGLVTLFLARGTLLEGGALAMTLGHVVLGRDAWALAVSRSHERVHVRQAERWGPFFLPAYLLASGIAWARGQRAYMDNPFEREAYANEARERESRDLRI